MPRTCKCNLIWEKGLCRFTKLRILLWKGHPAWSRWNLNSVKRLYKIMAEGYLSQQRRQIHSGNSHVKMDTETGGLCSQSRWPQLPEVRREAWNRFLPQRLCTECGLQNSERINRYHPMNLSSHTYAETWLVGRTSHTQRYQCTPQADISRNKERQSPQVKKLHARGRREQFNCVGHDSWAFSSDSAHE